MEIPVIWWMVLVEGLIILALVYACIILSNKVSKEISRTISYFKKSNNSIHF